MPTSELPEPQGRGWRARLELRFERAGAATRLALNRHHGPLRLLRALDGGDGSCHAIVVHPPGGLVGGDRLDLDVALDRDARVLCTTPGAQKWYRTTGAVAVATSRVRVGPGALLEWLPQPAIVYDAARLEQSIAFELAPDARTIGWECLVLGRAAMGERFLHGSLRQRLELRIGDRLAWAERTHALAGDRLFASPLGWAGRTVAATVWAVGGADDDLLGAWRGSLAAGRDRAVEGAATMPEPGLLLARLLGDDAEAVLGSAQALWRLARPAVAGVPARSPRIWFT